MTTPMGRRMGKLSNGLVASLTRAGVSIKGSRVLSVRGDASIDSTAARPFSTAVTL